MQYFVNKNENGAEVIISGDFTYRDYNDFFEATAFVEDKNTKECVINMMNVNFIDSEALGMILTLSETARNRYVVIIKNAQGMVKRTLQDLQFDRIIKCQW